jgi:general secretion pathway protein D
LKEAVQRFPESQIEPKVSGPISFDLNKGSRGDYEALGELAGLNILFDADFADRALGPVHIADEDIFEAFDRLSLMTGNFIEVLDSKTLLVSPNNATKRRENQIQVLKTIYPSYATSPQDLSGLVTMLRSTLQMRYLAISTDVKGIVLRDSSANIAVAEKLVDQVGKSSSSQPIGFDRLGNLYTPEGKEIRQVFTRSLGSSDRTVPSFFGRYE